MGKTEEKQKNPKKFTAQRFLQNQLRLFIINKMF